MVTLILSGGAGTRLWPLSRKSMAKQFVKLIDEQSLYQKNFDRNQQFSDRFLVVTNKDQLMVAKRQAIAYEDKSDFLVEPVGRNTAPAIALSCMQLDPEELVLVTPSDHLIENDTRYQQAIDQAKLLAEDGKLVTFGIEPTSPDTGYGYIECNGTDVLSFYEKPNRETAEMYLAKGNFVWNSGMFCFKAGAFLNELKKYSPLIYEACKSANIFTNNGVMTLSEDDMNRIPEDSIDYAVMEKSSLISVVSSSFSWTDLGTFDSLYDIYQKDEEGNTKTSDYTAYKSSGNLLYGKGKKICVAGVQDLIVVDTEDALLITRRGESQEVKQLVNLLKKKDPTAMNLATVSYHSWGKMIVMDSCGQKSIMKSIVLPGKAMKHVAGKKTETWTIVEGVGAFENETKHYKNHRAKRFCKHGTYTIETAHTNTAYRKY